MHVSKAKLFRGKQPQAELVSVRVEGQDLILFNESATVARWPRDLVFRDPTHSVSVVLGCGTDDERLELLNGAILPYLKINKEVWSKEGLSDKLGTFAIFTAFTIAVLGLILYNIRPITRAIASRIPMEYERKLGDAAASGLKLEACKLNAEQQDAADALMARLYRHNPEGRANVRLYFVPSRTPNAYTLPGGDIFVFSGLLKKAVTDSEVAGVLAHEIEHVERRHVMESVTKALLLTGLFNFVAGDFSALVLIDPSTAANLMGLKLSREMEAEADDGAIKRLNATGISPAGMAHFFETMHEKQGKMEGTMAFLSTHPLSEARMKHFREAAERAPKQTEEVLSAKQWAALNTVCSDSPSESNDGED